MIVLDHGYGQAVRRIEAFVREPIAIADPALIDGFLLEGNDPHHPIVLDLNIQGRAE